MNARVTSNVISIRKILKMFRKFFVLFLCVLINTTIPVNAQDFGTNQVLKISSILINSTTPAEEPVKSLGDNSVVKIQLYYECLCPDCRKFDSKAFKETVLQLASELDIHLYPYGNAKTVDHGDGNYEFICQHGPAECYGNKLHACAIDVLQNITMAVLYNSCLMDYSQSRNGSDDAAADVCGTSMGIDSDPIKLCAKGAKGSKLLKFYGDESKKAAFNSVPHILINGGPGRYDHFKEDVCKAFQNPPLQCKNNSK